MDFFMVTNHTRARLSEWPTHFQPNKEEAFE